MGPIGPDDPRLFPHFKNQGTSSTDAIQFWGVVGLEGDLLRPGSPLHDVDIVVMGGAWQTTAGPPPPSCGLPLSLFLLAPMEFSSARSALLYFGAPLQFHFTWMPCRDVPCHDSGDGVHFSADADTDFHGQAFRERRIALSQHYCTSSWTGCMSQATSSAIKPDRRVIEATSKGGGGEAMLRVDLQFQPKPFLGNPLFHRIRRLTYTVALCWY